jgi:hypothetical protein
MDKDPNRIEPSESQVEYVSMRQLNSERLKGLSGRFAEELAVVSFEPQDSEQRAANPFESAPHPAQGEAKPVPKPLQNIQRKFSTSWLNMQQFLGEKKQNRNWDTKFK